MTSTSTGTGRSNNKAMSTETLGPWAQTHPWTLSKSMWEAKSSFEFFRAWNERPKSVMRNFDFHGFLEEGEGGEVDEFARIFLIM